GAAVALERETVLLGAGDLAARDQPGLAALLDVLRRLAHALQRKHFFHARIRITPAQRGVPSRDIARRAEGLGVLGHAVGRAGHALDPARDQDVRLAAADGAGRLVDGGERAGAKAVRRDARHAVRQAGEQGAHAGDVAVVLARLVGAA